MNKEEVWQHRSKKKKKKFFWVADSKLEVSCKQQFLKPHRRASVGVLLNRSEMRNHAVFIDK